MKEIIKKLVSTDNTIDEKAVVGFLSFIIMILFALSDIVTGYFGLDFKVNEFIYDSFFWLTLGAFGISAISRISSK